MTARVRRSVPAWPIWMAPAAIAGTWAAGWAAGVAVAIAQAARGADRVDAPALLLLVALTAAGGVATVVALAARVAPPRPDAFGVRPVPLRLGAVGVALGVGVVALAAAPAELLGGALGSLERPRGAVGAEPLGAGPGRARSHGRGSRRRRRELRAGPRADRAAAGRAAPARVRAPHPRAPSRRAHGRRGARAADRADVRRRRRGGLADAARTRPRCRARRALPRDGVDPARRRRVDLLGGLRARTRVRLGCRGTRCCWGSPAAAWRWRRGSSQPCPAAASIPGDLAIADRIKSDVTTALKAGDRDRVGALRLVLSELQKAAKEGGADEQAVLRRERKRRRESETAYREAGRPELAEAEAYEAGVIEAYLPAELGDEELDALVARAIEETGRRGPAGHGQGDQARDGGRRRARRRKAGVDEGEGSAQLDGTTATGALQRGGGRAGRRAGRDPQDARGAPQRGHLPARQRGDPRRRPRGGQLAATVVRELSELVERGHEIGPATIESVSARARPGGIAEQGARRGRLAPPQPQGRSEVRQPEALRRRDPALDDHLRGRPRRHRQDVPRDGDGRRRALAPRGQPHHPHPPRRRGRRAARLPARRPDGEGRPVPAPAVRRAARHDGRRARRGAPRARRDRGRAAGLHARPHAQRLVRDPRRGAEHVARADEDVPHPARIRLEDGRHRRHHADRPAARAAVRPRRGRRHPRRASTASSSCASAARTSSATSWCSGSSRPTTSTRRARRRGCGRRTTAAARREPAGGGRARRRPSGRAGPARVRARRRDRRAWRTGTSPSRSSTPEEIAALNARAPRQGRPDRRALVPRRRRRPDAPASASSATS